MGTLLLDMPNLFSVALSIFALVQLVQRLPWPASWLRQRPLSCPTCLSWHASIVGWSFMSRELLWSSLSFWAAAAGLAMLFDALLTHWKGATWTGGSPPET